MCLENTQALLYAVAAKHFFILKARDPLRLVGHVTAPEPPLAGRQGPEP
jgi:hypothetical protein